MKNLLFLFLFITKLSLILTISEENGLLKLTDNDFLSTANEHDYLFVIFYAPWCPHSKKLLSELEQASLILSQEKILIAKVDSTSEKKLTEQYQIQGFPSLKLFLNKNINDPIEYSGSRKKIDIITWVRKKTGFLYKEIKTENELENYKQENKVSIFYFGSNSQDISLLKTISEKIEEIPFAKIEDKKLIEKIKEKKEKFILYKNFDENRIEIPKNKEKDMISFIYQYSTERYFIYDDVVSDLIFTKNIPGLFLFTTENKKKINEYTTLLKKIANKNENKIKIILVNVDDEYCSRFLDFLGIDKQQLPIVKILDTKNYDGNFSNIKKFSLKNEINEKNINEFILQWENNKLISELKSKPIPKKNNENVFILVGDNYKKEVIENKKDVMVVFYASWCGHCKALLPEYEKLAANYKKLKNKIMFSKIDATENEVEGVELDGFPTILFYPGIKK